MASSTPENSSSTLSSANSAASKTYPLFQSSSLSSSIKLDRGNYLVWASIVLPLIEGNLLESHIDGLGSAPPRRVAGSSEINPEFQEWRAVDRLLVGWLRNTFTLEVGSQLLHCNTARELWVAARDLTAASTRSRVMLYQTELTTLVKGSMKMEEYLSRMKVISDQLALAGAPVSNETLINNTLRGLVDHNYNAIAVKLMDENRSWIEVQTTLLTYESRLEQVNAFSQLSIQPSVNLVQKESSPSHGGRDNRGGEQRRSNDSDRPWRGGQRGSRGGSRGGRRVDFEVEMVAEAILMAVLVSLIDPFALIVSALDIIMIRAGLAWMPKVVVVHLLGIITEMRMVIFLSLIMQAHRL